MNDGAYVPITRFSLSNVLLKSHNALSFLRNKRANPSDQIRNECCGKTKCRFEERKEIAENVGWDRVNAAMCEVSIRENQVCTCKPKSGSITFECGNDLSNCPNPCKEFQCNNGRTCASYSHTCDSNNDCGNWQDEIGCKTKYSEDQIKNNIRLKYANQYNSFYGSVEIYNRPICDDSWTNQNAQVVCRTLNFPPGTLAIGWGNEQVSTNFIMDDVICSGEESSLKHCNHKTYHNCGPTEGAAVICLASNLLKLTPFNSESGKNEGIVLFNDIPICADGWNFRAAQVVCNHLYGIEFKIPVPVYDYQTNVGQKSSIFYLTSIVCNGTESLLAQCQIKISKSCSTHVASVQCARCSPFKLMDIVKKIKVDGSIVEVYQSVEAAISELTAECRSWNCSILNPVYSEFCTVRAFLNEIKDFTKSGMKNNIILYTDINHFGLLSYKFLKGNFEKIRNDIDSLGQTLSTELGEYFTRLAQFDEQTAKSHKENALNILSESKSRCESESIKLSNQLSSIITYALGVTASDIVSKTVVLALRIVGALNPIKWLTGSETSAVDIKEALSEVAKQAVRNKQVKYFKSNFIPKLDNLVKQIFVRVNKNKETLDTIRHFVETIEKNGEFKKEQLVKFSEHADKYSPAITQSDISEFGAILSQMIEKFCEVIENPDTELGTVPAGIAAHQGLCPNAKVTAPVLISLYQEVATQELTILENFSKYVRATIAKDAANKLSTSMKSSSSNQLYKLLTKYEALYLIRYHKIIIIKNACNYLTYMNHGIEKPVCTDLLENPSGDPGILINTVPTPMCQCRNCFTKKGDFLIPATMTGENNSIDLSTLYDANAEFTKGFAYLNIPNKDWLVENKWISEHEQGPFFLKKLNIHLPPALNFSHEVNIKLTLLDNQLQGKSYMFEGGVIVKNQYIENQSKCSQYNPYITESCNKKAGTFCLNVDGVINGELLPRLDGSKWRVELRSNQILPKVYSETKLFLQATAEFCYQTKLQSKPKYNLGKSGAFYRNVQDCCSDNGMFIDQILLNEFPHSRPCQACPQGSSPRLNGYFCEKCPAGYEPNNLVYFGCIPCPKNKFKAFAGQHACDSCLDGKTSLEGALYCY
ncbi:uncharacterized protein LOC105846303 isoform X2 [Hydra vulgaris]|uniref:Uncharacterized protein LOC105846303 isoform X2 n=1 Tax=Hydra vulgaris TaxID=6087 RepID=A0ABM4CRY7_HYDVU